MKIPRPIIYTVADVLGSFYYSHTKLDTLFGEHGFPGEPPQGNCVKKCQQWLRRANDEAEHEAMQMLSNVLSWREQNWTGLCDQNWKTDGAQKNAVGGLCG